MPITILENRYVVLGVTGSIACYKSADLASKLTQAGARVETILTEAARKFVTPLTFSSVTGQAVHESMWQMDSHVGHVQLGEQADLVLIAPATAHTLAKLAAGLADNLLTVTALAARCPVMVAPAMDGGMYEHPATQANLAILKDRGVYVAGPAEGRMASGLMGWGRMVEPAELVGHARLVLGRGGPLRDRRVVVTAGPTREPLDPVRFLSNRSTGKQGIALAQAALDMGAQVTLISGPTSEPVPTGTEYVPVETAMEMREAVLEAVANADILLMAAAVSDFRPQERSDQKIKKGELEDDALQLPLARNPDILVEVRQYRRRSGWPRVTLGFAAETSNAAAYGEEKLKKKGLDFIAVNDVSEQDAGFAVDTNRVTLIGTGGYSRSLPLGSKSAVAESILAAVIDRLGA